jgi:hypothetical protein
MDYQQKYLKYKLKYLNLKTKLIGGAYHVFPIQRAHAAYGSEPHTSWFYMPLIYWSLANAVQEVEFPPSFYAALEETIPLGHNLPFYDADSFRLWIRNRCSRLGILSRQDFLNRNIPNPITAGEMFNEDSPFHISGHQQEVILYENADIRIFFELLTVAFIRHAATPEGVAGGDIRYRYNLD